MGILLGEEDNTPDWDKEIARLTGNAEAEERRYCRGNGRTDLF